MQHTRRVPFQSVTTKQASTGLDFDHDQACAARTFYRRIKAGYLRDRHLLPPGARILLDTVLQGIEDDFRDHEHTEYALDRTLRIPTMLMLAREMLAAQSTPHPGARHRPPSPRRN